MQRAKTVAVILIIVISLLPLYVLYVYLQRILHPKKSFRHFVNWLLAVFVLIFVYSFLLVFIIKMLFPAA